MAKNEEEKEESAEELNAKRKKEWDELQENKKIKNKPEGALKVFGEILKEGFTGRKGYKEHR